MQIKRESPSVYRLVYGLQGVISLLVKCRHLESQLKVSVVVFQLRLDLQPPEQTDFYRKRFFTTGINLQGTKLTFYWCVSFCWRGFCHLSSPVSPVSEPSCWSLRAGFCAAAHPVEKSLNKNSIIFGNTYTFFA